MSIIYVSTNIVYYVYNILLTSQKQYFIRSS